MDRRGFLTRTIGAGLAAVTTKLWLPPVSTALAQPERTVFVPPTNGWPDFDIDTDIAALRRWMSVDTSYDIETFEPLPNEVFMFRPSDTVRVEVAGQSGVMWIQSIDHDFRTHRIRVRGQGVESFLGHKFDPPIATIKPTRMTITRSMRPNSSGYWG